MATPKDEPTTEEEAQALRRYLERGAETAIDPTRRISPNQEIEMELTDRTVVSFDATQAELANALEEEDQVILEVTIENVGSTAQPPVLVYLSEAAAERNQGPDDPEFVGALAFFVDPSHHTMEKLVYRLDATKGLRRAERGQEPVTAVFVPAPPLPGGVPAGVSPPRLAAATFEVVRSTVNEGS